MKMKNTIKCMTAGAMAFLLCVLAVMPVFAMSPLTPDYGMDVYSVFPKGRRSNLRLDSLALTYDISEMPKESYSDTNDFLAYSSTLRMDYTLYNPTDTEQTVQLYFAAGNLPQYATGIGREYSSAQHAAACRVEIGGEQITPELRHVWTPFTSEQQATYDTYDPREYVENLRDTYAQHALLTPDLPVRIYTYQPISDQGETHFYYDMSASFDHAASRTLVFTNDYAGATQKNGKTILVQRVWEDALVKLYVLGEDIGEVAWTLTDDDGAVKGKAKLLETQDTTFGELAMQYYDPDTGVLEHDWYNAVLDMMEYSRLTGTGVLGAELQWVNFDLASNLQTFLSYSVTLAPGRRTVNTVTTPVYPDAMHYYQPTAGTFRFHFHGGFDWKSVGKYTVRINTKYKIMPDEVNSVSVDDYQKDRNGYTLPERTTPTHAYTFTLCKSKNPVMTADFGFFLIVFMVVVLPVFSLAGGAWMLIKLLVGAIFLVILVIKKQKSRKAISGQFQSDHSKDCEE